MRLFPGFHGPSSAKPMTNSLSPLLKSEWVLAWRIWRLGGVKGGRSPAQRTLDADQAPVRCRQVECGMLSLST